MSKNYLKKKKSLVSGCTFCSSVVNVCQFHIPLSEILRDFILVIRNYKRVDSSLLEYFRWDLKLFWMSISLCYPCYDPMLIVTYTRLG